MTYSFRQVKQFVWKGACAFFGCIGAIWGLMRKAAHAYMRLGFWGASRKIRYFIQQDGLLDRLKVVTGQSPYKNKWGGRFGYTAHDPLISVIAVNFNGAVHLPKFLESLSKQSYRIFEVIIIDNGSKDDSEEVVNRCKTIFSCEVRFVKTGKNLGFAEGNNVALDHAKGEFLALLNVDTQVHEDWLRELVEAIRVEGDVAVVAPKILFLSRFQDLEICSDQKVVLDLKILRSSLCYDKFFVRAGVDNDGNLESDDSHNIIVSIPVQEEPIEIRLWALTTHAGNVEFRTRTKVICRTSLAHQVSLALDFSIDGVGNAGFIVNNAGSISDSDGMPRDRGFAEYDQGQYDKKCYLPYFCGCAALIRRAAIIDREIFVPEFFAYYEDSELSRWITSSGFKILYAPRSIVFHRHSATSSEGSPTWRYLVERSQSMFTFTGVVEVLMKKLAEVRVRYTDSVNPELMSILADYDQRLIQRLNAGEQLVKRRRAIGIYNSFWNTRGGGESHALSIASDLQQWGPIELISESDFDIDFLSEYFAIDLGRCRKLVLPNIHNKWTERFFVFINSTFCSVLPSRAPHSWYLVSFPHRHASQKMLKSYFFLFNSQYTEKWARRFWGRDIRGHVIYPVRMLRASHEKKRLLSKHEKKKVILSVGRFNPFGHSKNQLEIAKAYRSLVTEMPDANQWKLVLAGSLDYDQSDHVAYFHSVKRCVKGLSAELLPNMERDDLDQLFSDAIIYVHATGVGCHREREPEKFEHFGITPVEAMQFGCIPVVFDTGGPADLVRCLDIGYCFSSEESLQATLKILMHRDFSVLIRESKIVQERGSQFVDAESCKPLPIDALIENFTK